MVTPTPIHRAFSARPDPLDESLLRHGADWTVEDRRRALGSAPHLDPNDERHDAVVGRLLEANADDALPVRPSALSDGSGQPLASGMARLADRLATATQRDGASEAVRSWQMALNEARDGYEPEDAQRPPALMTDGLLGPKTVRTTRWHLSRSTPQQLIGRFDAVHRMRRQAGDLSDGAGDEAELVPVQGAAAAPGMPMPGAPYKPGPTDAEKKAGAKLGQIVDRNLQRRFGISPGGTAKQIGADLEQFFDKLHQATTIATDLAAKPLFGLDIEKGRENNRATSLPGSEAAPSDLPKKTELLPDTVPVEQERYPAIEIPIQDMVIERKGKPRTIELNSNLAGTMLEIGNASGVKLSHVGGARNDKKEDVSETHSKNYAIGGLAGGSWSDVTVESEKTKRRCHVNTVDLSSRTSGPDYRESGSELQSLRNLRINVKDGDVVVTVPKPWKGYELDMIKLYEVLARCIEEIDRPWIPKPQHEPAPWYRYGGGGEP